jgi:hypothetical protein
LGCSPARLHKLLKKAQVLPPPMPRSARPNSASVSRQIPPPRDPVSCGAIPRYQASLLNPNYSGMRGPPSPGPIATNLAALRLHTEGRYSSTRSVNYRWRHKVTLLRDPQEGEVRRICGNRAIGVDIRMIAATNRNLISEVNAGRFRADLFHRLAVAVIRTHRRGPKVGSDIGTFLQFSGNSISRMVR